MAPVTDFRAAVLRGAKMTQTNPNTDLCQDEGYGQLFLQFCQRPARPIGQFASKRQCDRRARRAVLAASDVVTPENIGAMKLTATRLDDLGGCSGYHGLGKANA